MPRAFKHRDMRARIALVERNTVVGVNFLTTGAVVSALSYVLIRSVPISALGLEVAVVGALILLVVPESIPKDAYMAILSDMVSNVEMILKESGLRERAYFIQMADGEVRSLIPLSGTTLTAAEISALEKSPNRFIINYEAELGLLIVPPGNQIVSLVNIERGADLEESLKTALVGSSDLAGSVLAVEDEGSKKIRIQISKPSIVLESPYFNACLGTPASSIACCVAAVVKGRPVRIVEEKFDPALVRLTLEVIQ